MAAATHTMTLQPPHGFHDVTLPEGRPALRAFLDRALVTREFQGAASEREQVHLLHGWAANSNLKVSLQELADFFQVEKSTIHHHLKKPVEPGESTNPCNNPCNNGRPSVLTQSQQADLKTFIRGRFDRRCPASYEDCRDFLIERFDLSINVKTLRGMVDRWADFRVVDGVPMEDSRNFSDRNEIDEYFARLGEMLDVAKIPPAFVINADETGFQEFVDARGSARIVPTEYPLNSVPVPVTRAEKRATLLAAISADGTYLRPMVVVPRDTMERELLLRGYTPDKIHYGRSEKGFMNTQLFTEWGRHTLTPEMRRRRLDHHYDGPILLLVDGFGCHHSDGFTSMCEEEGIVCVFLPPHTSDQLQACDLGLFALQKRWSSNIQIDGDLNRQTKQVIRIVDSLRMAGTFKNITGAFRKAGLVTFLDDDLRLMVRVDTRYASAVRHLQGDDTLPLDGDKRRLLI